MRGRRLVLALVAALLPATAIGQNTPPDLPTVISPLKSEPDPNGVNVTTGKKVMEMPVVLSVPADPRLTFDRVQNAAPYILGTIDHNAPDQPLASSWSAHFGGEQSESFRCTNDDVCISVTYSGANFGYAGRSVQLPGSGATYNFGTLQSRVAGFTKDTEQRYATSITYPDGETIIYTYNAGFVPGDPYPPCPHIGNCRTYYRPTRVASNTGYYITITYQYTGTDASNPLWGVPAEAAIYSPSNVLIRRLVYSGATITDYGNSVTNVGGRSFTAVGVNNGLGAQLETANGSVTLPGEASAQITIVGSNSHGTWGQPLIDSVTRDAVGWTYTYVNARGVNVGASSPLAVAYNSITASGPNGYSVSYAMSVPTATVPAMHINSRTDALGHTTSFSYDANHGDRLIGMTMPEGNAVNLTYDLCGNVLTKTSVAKLGSGLTNLVESAVYPDPSIPENLCPNVLSYRPNSYTDARGNVFNYSYNSGGQMTQELAPADASGVRRETDLTYANSGAGISRKTVVRICGQTTSCAASAESRTEFGYFATGDLANSNLPLTVTQKDEATAATRVTTYSYDLAGRPTVIDGPLAGTGDAKYFQYDKFGRKIWEVGELAPNNLRLAKFFTYRDSDDKVTNVQTGTVACTTACDTAALTLTLLQQTDTSYDSRRYPIRETTYKGATTYSVTDRSFLDRGLAECTTVRMNLAALPAASDHGACALGTQGSQGADRITKNSYDNAGELTLVQKAYLTPDQANYVAYTYTANGKQQFVTDANGNKAQFTYDGFDRLLKWNFPSKTTPGVVSTTDFEQYGYDANGNRTSLRKRDASTLTYTYDNLNRLTVKVVPSRADLTPAQTRDVFYGYDIAGRQLFARFDAGTVGSDGVTNTYNGFGDLLTSSLKMGTFTKTLTSAYDGAGRRTQLTHPDAQAFTYAYDNLSRLSGVYQGVGTATPLDTFTYANNGLVSTRGEGATSASSATYGWDDVNRLTSQADAFLSGTNNVNWTFAYNPASQIVTETRSNDAYSQAVAQGSTAYAVNGLNQYSSVGGAAYIYDANGNLTGDGSSSYTFDIENRLVKAIAGATTTNVIYDPLGRLFETNQGTSATTTRFLTDGDAMVLELDSANAVTNRFVHGSNAAADDPLVWYSGSTLTIKRWLHADRLGSIVAWTNASGGSPTINTYDEYGVPATTNTGRFQYTGQAYIPEVKLYYYKARFYSPGLGRFMQTDPVGYDGGINLYAYIEGDPVNGTDFSGDCPVGTKCEDTSGLQGMEGTSAEATRIPQSSPPTQPQAQGHSDAGASKQETGQSSVANTSRDRSKASTEPTGDAPFYFNGNAWTADPLYKKPKYSNAFDYGVGAIVMAPVAVIGAVEAAGAVTGAGSRVLASDVLRLGPTRVPNQLISGPGATGSTRVGTAIRSGGRGMRYWMHIHRYNWYNPFTWFGYTPTLKP